MASDRDFQQQIDKTLDFEGGYSNDPDDAGGETKYGISKRSYPSINIAALTRSEAIEIYRRDYWNTLPPDGLPTLIAQKVFDLSVNMGKHRAILILQSAVNHITAENPLTVDGRLGPNTLNAVNRQQATVLLKAIKTEAANYYQSLASHHPAMNKFLRGWLRRALA